MILDAIYNINFLKYSNTLSIMKLLSKINSMIATELNNNYNKK